MTTLSSLDHEEIVRRISRDLADAYDEEIEMEIEDRHSLPEGHASGDGTAFPPYRREYFQ